MLKGAGVLPSTWGLISSGCAPGGRIGLQHSEPLHHSQKPKFVWIHPNSSRLWAVAPFLPTGSPGCTAQLPAYSSLRSGQIARWWRPWQHERVMSQRQLGLLFLQQDLNFRPSSCESLKLTFALSININFIISRQRWQNEPIYRSCTFHPSPTSDKRETKGVRRKSQI